MAAAREKKLLNFLKFVDQWAYEADLVLTEHGAESSELAKLRRRIARVKGALQHEKPAKTA